MVIKNYCKKHQMTQDQLGEKVAVSGAYLSMIDSGKRHARPQLALKLHRISNGEIPFDTLCPWVAEYNQLTKS